MDVAHEAQTGILDPLLRSFRDAGAGVLSEHWPYLLLLLVIVVLARILRSASIKGKIGEAAVSLGALRKLEKEGYRIFNDLVLPRPDKKGTTQIDHLVVAPTGVFVVETKNYAGWIFGSADSRQWTQTLRGRKSRFQNPLHQNALHINALAAATGIPKDRFKSVVYFVGDALLKTDLPPEVITRGLASYVRGHREAVVSADELERLFTVLESFEAQGAAASWAHGRQMRALRRD